MAMKKNLSKTELFGIFLELIKSNKIWFIFNMVINRELPTIY
jgi:hypothetical protein